GGERRRVEGDHHVLLPAVVAEPDLLPRPAFACCVAGGGQLEVRRFFADLEPPDRPGGLCHVVSICAPARRWRRVYCDGAAPGVTGHPLPSRCHDSQQSGFPRFGGVFPASLAVARRSAPVSPLIVDLLRRYGARSRRRTGLCLALPEAQLESTPPGWQRSQKAWIASSVPSQPQFPCWRSPPAQSPRRPPIWSARATSSSVPRTSTRGRARWTRRRSSSPG